jgi:hypothetical protein
MMGAHDASIVRNSAKLQNPLQKQAWAILIWTGINDLGIIMFNSFEIND